jgi:hypothetical protein
MDISTVTIPLLSSVGSFFGAWLAAHFALRRFYHEKVWERKTVAYTAIFDAIHDMGMWFEQHFNAMVRNRELSEEKQDELTATYQTARKTFERHLTSEIWLIPDDIRKRLDDLQNALDKLDDHHDWALIVSEGNKIVFEGTNELREMVRKDLLLNPNFLGRLWVSLDMLGIGRSK